MLDVRDLTVRFGSRVVLERACLRVDDGEVVALFGPSGSGKSTLLRAIAGLVALDEGAIAVDGRDITHQPTHRRGIGMVFQDDQLFPHRDVAANVAFGLRMQGVAAREQRRRVSELLALVGLEGFESRHVTDLSGGEATRVALARSLAPAPRAILLDEPLTGLDRDLHDRLAGELARILRAARTTAVMVTHDRAEAVVVADRVVTMDGLQRGDSRPSSVVELTATDTHDLRRRVLRHGTPSTDVVFSGDDDPATLHLGVVDGAGRPVAISTWGRRPFPSDPASLPGVQLRGMAVDPDQRDRGLGAALLEAGIERAFAEGAEVVWANARDVAIAFYTRHGFEIVGDGFTTADTAMPHHRIRRSRVPFSAWSDPQEG